MSACIYVLRRKKILIIKKIKIENEILELEVDLRFALL